MLPDYVTPEAERWVWNIRESLLVLCTNVSKTHETWSSKTGGWFSLCFDSKPYQNLKLWSQIFCSFVGSTVHHLVFTVINLKYNQLRCWNIYKKCQKAKTSCSLLGLAFTLKHLRFSFWVCLYLLLWQKKYFPSTLQKQTYLFASCICLMVLFQSLSVPLQGLFFPWKKMTVWLKGIVPTTLPFQVATYTSHLCLNKFYNNYNFFTWERIRGSDFVSKDFWSLCTVPTNVFIVRVMKARRLYAEHVLDECSMSSSQKPAKCQLDMIKLMSSSESVVYYFKLQIICRHGHFKIG